MDFQIKTDTLMLAKSLYDLNAEWFSANINNAVFIGYRKGATELPIINDMIRDGAQCIRLEVWRPNCEECKDDCNTPILNMNMLDMEKYFVNDSVDMIWAAQVLEHLDGPEAFHMLKVFKDVARKIVVVETPYGEYKQGSINNNPYEEHKSALLPKHFEVAEYKTWVGHYPHEENPKHILSIYDKT